MIYVCVCVCVCEYISVVSMCVRACVRMYVCMWYEDGTMQCARRHRASEECPTSGTKTRTGTGAVTGRR